MAFRPAVRRSEPAGQPRAESIVRLPTPAKGREAIIFEVNPGSRRDFESFTRRLKRLAAPSDPGMKPLVLAGGIPVGVSLAPELLDKYREWARGNGRPPLQVLSNGPDVRTFWKLAELEVKNRIRLVPLGRENPMAMARQIANARLPLSFVSEDHSARVATLLETRHRLDVRHV